MVFIVALAQTHPHSPGRPRGFQWNGPSVSIQLIWLIIKLSAALAETRLRFLPLCHPNGFPASLDGEIKEKEADREEMEKVIVLFPPPHL